MLKPIVEFRIYVGSVWQSTHSTVRAARREIKSRKTVYVVIGDGDPTIRIFKAITEFTEVGI